MNQQLPLYAEPERQTYQSGTLTGAVAIISGTCIGGGMLALPLVTSQAGFAPSLLLGLLCWLYMLSTGLLFLEATLWMEDGANVTSITRHFLGTIGQWISSASFLLLYCCLLISYLAAGTQVIRHLLEASMVPLPSWSILPLFTLPFAIIVYKGTKIIDRSNMALVIGLMLSYVILIAAGLDELNPFLLERTNWPLAYLALPILFSAYGYHNVIPSLSTYLRRDVSKLYMALIIGTLIPFIIYTVWQALLMGIIPYEQLHAAQEQGVCVSQLLWLHTGNRWVIAASTFFVLFAVTTSLLGVALSMVDFLADTFQCKRTGSSRLLLCSFTFLLPAVMAYFYPTVFVKALGVAGGFGEAILNGLIPIMLVWCGRYKMGLHSRCRLPGGKKTLSLLLLFTLVTIAIEVSLLYS